MLVIGPRPKYFPFCGDLCSPHGTSLSSHYSSSISLTFLTWKHSSDTSTDSLSLKKAHFHSAFCPSHTSINLRLVFYLLLQNYASTAPTSVHTHASEMLIVIFIVSAIFNTISICTFVFYSRGGISISIGLASAN